MPTPVRALVLFLFGLTPTVAKSDSPRTLGRIETLDPAMDRWVGADTPIEVLASGFTWCEGPAVMPGDGDPQLLLSDIPRNTIYRWSEAEGVTTYMRPSGYTGVAYYGLEPGSNGLAFDGRGRLLACEHGDRRLSLLTPGGGKVTLTDRYEGRRFNSPNDLTLADDGTVYFTDPPYGLPERESDPRRELDFCGVYRLNPDGSLELLTDAIRRPNGIGLTPDGRSLIVAQSDPDEPVWYRLDLDAEAAPRVIADAREDVRRTAGLPDGLDIAADGTIFGSGPGGVYVMAPDGKRLGIIHTGRRTSNCVLDEDRHTLYITADDVVLRVALKTP